MYYVRCHVQPVLSDLNCQENAIKRDDIGNRGQYGQYEECKEMAVDEDVGGRKG